jgi:hypothetical protein
MKLLKFFGRFEAEYSHSPGRCGVDIGPAISSTHGGDALAQHAYELHCRGRQVGACDNLKNITPTGVDNIEAPLLELRCCQKRGAPPPAYVLAGSAFLGREHLPPILDQLTSA